MILDNVPDYKRLNPLVLMAKQISDVSYLTPRDFRPGSFQRLRD